MWEHVLPIHHDGVRGWLEDLMTQRGSSRFAIEESRLDHDTVLQVQHVRGHAELVHCFAQTTDVFWKFFCQNVPKICERAVEMRGYQSKRHA